MGSHFSLLLITKFLLFFASLANRQETIQNHAHIDQIVRDYAIKFYTNHQKTGFIYPLRLPANISGVRADTVRYRSGSLRRYGAVVKEFRLPPGTMVHPDVKRLIVVRENLGNWSSLYHHYTKKIAGYQFLSPILGLLLYEATDTNCIIPLKLSVSADKEPVTIDFSNFSRISGENRPMCVAFDLDGTASLSYQTSSNLCVASREGHFGLVVETSPEMPGKEGGGESPSKWKVVVACSVGGGLGVFLLGLLCVALVKMKERHKIAEMERRAYEEEALQMSMVGHVRAPTAAVTRTMPVLENDYTP